MACSIEGIQPEFVPPCVSDSYCDQLAELLVNESALDELWRAQGLPTPPTTPERVYTPSNNDLEEDSESDYSQDLPLLNELILLAYGEEILTSAPVAVPTVATETTANLQDNLIQDCMWSSHVIDKSARKPPPTLTPHEAPTGHQTTPGEQGGEVYTPTPSPPPPPGTAVVVGGDGDHDDEGMESDCVSPSAVFPSLLTPNKLSAVGSKVDNTPVATETPEPTTSPVKRPARVLLRNRPSDDPDWEESSEEMSGRHGYERCQRRKRKLSTAAVGTGANGRQQPQSESSTSDEEIDVVTVTTYADRAKLPRKRHPSLSAPCSRQTSPHPPAPPPKRRKYHTKRLQRLSSAGSTVGETVESDDEARRASHNVLERKRRNDLKSSFQLLREEIPELEDNQRAPKVTILRKATDYIRHMQDLDKAAEAELVAEKRRKAKLLERLNRLRSGRV